MPLHELLHADTPASLRAALAALDGLEVVGVDVERADGDRYFRQAALIQVGGDGRVALVDPLTVDDLGVVTDFLAERITVLHAHENDLVPMAGAGVHPTRLADTAVAAAVLGLPTGLEPLLAEVLGVELAGDKEAMQRADWEARPLSERMCVYAAGDVADLPALWGELEGRLAETGRRRWYEEELAAQLAQPPVEERRAWTRLKGLGRLDVEARRRARALWHRREQLARDTDTAPGRVAADRVLVDLADNPPAAPAELGRRGMRRQAVRRFGAALLEAAADPSTVPIPPDDDGLESVAASRRPTSEEKALADRLRTRRAAVAERHGLDPGVLCPGRTLQGAVLRRPADAESLREALGVRHWQWQLLAEPFCDALGLPLPGKAAGDVTTTGKESDPDG